MKKSLKPLTFYDAIDSNKKKTWLIVFSISLLLFIVVYAIGYWFEFGWISVPIAFLAVFFTNFYAYYNSDKIILNISGAREPTKEEYPYLINVVEGLSIAGGIPVPKIYVIDDPSSNAFATGRDPQNSAIAVTTGLLEKLDRLELEGVIAHEISHIKHYDVRLQTISAVMERLASALEKIAKDPLPVKRANSMTAPLYIVNPLDKSWGENLLSTHPPVEERIRRLRIMGDRWKLLEKEGK